MNNSFTNKWYKGLTALFINLGCISELSVEHMKDMETWFLSQNYGKELGDEAQAYGFLGDIRLDIISLKGLGSPGLFCARFLQNTENAGINETQLVLFLGQKTRLCPRKSDNQVGETGKQR